MVSRDHGDATTPLLDDDKWSDDDEEEDIFVLYGPTLGRVIRQIRNFVVCGSASTKIE